MLPTQTLNPTGTSATGAKSTSSAKAKRDLGGDEDHLQSFNRDLVTERESTNAARLWWVGAGMTALGGVGYFYF